MVIEGIKLSKLGFLWLSMFSFLGAHGYIGKSMFFSAVWSYRPSWYGKSSIRALHSLGQFRQRKPVQRTSQKIRKLDRKWIEKENVDRKIYMRDTIGNICKILRYSTWDSAQEKLEKLSIRWDSYTVNQVLKSHPPMEKAWLFFNWASRLKGFKHDQFTYTTMLDIFGEARRIESMNYVFQRMQEKGIKIDAVTYTSLMHWYSNDGDVDGAVGVWKEMKTKGCGLTVVSYTAYMKILFDNKRAKEAADVYKEMIQSGCVPNCHTYTVLMVHLTGSGEFESILYDYCHISFFGTCLNYCFLDAFFLLYFFISDMSVVSSFTIPIFGLNAFIAILLV